MEKDIFELEVKCVSHWHREISPSPYRILEVPSFFSLYGFGEGVLNAFNFSFDHFFGFYSEQSVSRAKIGFELSQDEGRKLSMLGIKRPGLFGVKDVPLVTLLDMIGKTSYFLFNYKQEWWFKVKLLGKKRGRKEVKYPRLVKKFGNSPQQHPPRRKQTGLGGEERDVDEYLFEDGEKTEEFMLEPPPEAGFEESIEKLGRLVRGPVLTRVKGELKCLYDKRLLKFLGEEFPENSGFIALALLKNNPEKERVVDFVVALGNALCELTEKSQTLPLVIYYPIFRLARQMYSLGMADEANSVLLDYTLIHRFSDLDRDFTMIQDCFREAFQQGFSGEALVALVWVLQKKKNTLFETWQEKVKVVRKILESDFDEETKVAISYTLAMVPILHNISKGIGKIEGFRQVLDERASEALKKIVEEGRVRGIKEEQSTREVICDADSLEKMESVKGFIEKETGKEYGEINLHEFLEILFTDYFEYLFKHESPYGRSFIDPVIILLFRLSSLSFPPVACRHAINVLLENMGKEKATGFIQLLLKRYETHSYKEASLVGSVLDSVRDQAELFKGKENEEMINTLEEYTDYHLLQGRRKAYRALYQLTKDEKYPKEASNDRAKKVRKWAEKTL